MKPLEELVRPNIRALKPYSTARDEFSGGEITTWLDANENPYDNGVNRYPDPHQKLLKQKIAALKGVREEQVFIGNGSDEAIDLCYRIFCRPGVDNAVSIAPTYGMYRVAADINDVEMREVPLGADFSLPTDALLAAADERTRLLWLCSPNNPTGNAFPANGCSANSTAWSSSTKPTSTSPPGRDSSRASANSGTSSSCKPSRRRGAWRGFASDWHSRRKPSPDFSHA